MKRPSIDDIYLISYTSGTTGFPKGVMLSHMNAVAGTTLSDEEKKGASGVGDTHISYLPLAHLYE